MRSLPLLLLLVSPTVGCGFGLRGGISPTVDTNGGFGAQLYVGYALGLADLETRRSLVGAIHGETSYLSGEQGPTIALVGGPEIEVLGPISWRGGFRGGVGSSFKTGDTFKFFGVAAAVLPNRRPRNRTLGTGRPTSTRGFGAEVRVLYVGGEEWDDAVQFSLGLVYEAYVISDLKVIP